MKELKTMLSSNADDYRFKCCATTFEVKDELCRVIDAYRLKYIDAQKLESLIKEYLTAYELLIYECPKSHYLKISIYNYLGQKRINILKGIMNIDVNPERLKKVEASKHKREEKRLSKINKAK